MENARRITPFRTAFVNRTGDASHATRAEIYMLRLEATARAASEAITGMTHNGSGSLEAAVLCNNATLGEVADDDSGDPMELALLRAGRRAAHARWAGLLGEYPPVLLMRSMPSQKMMATVHRRGERYFFAIKGAPEATNAREVLIENGGIAWMRPSAPNVSIAWSSSDARACGWH